MTTWIIGGAVALAALGCICVIVKDKKEGKGCCGDCSKCRGCH